METKPCNRGEAMTKLEDSIKCLKMTIKKQQKIGLDKNENLRMKVLLRQTFNKNQKRLQADLKAFKNDAIFQRAVDCKRKRESCEETPTKKTK
ncbi:hypothetical protein CHUAL_006270 [Chamberlinius hualienensis]